MNISEADIECYINNNNVLKYRYNASQFSDKDRVQISFVTALLDAISKNGYYPKKFSYSNDQGFSLDYIPLNELDPRKNPFTCSLAKSGTQWKMCLDGNIVQDLIFLESYDIDILIEALTNAKNVCTILNAKNDFEFIYVSDK